MPSPIGHALAGAAAGTLISKRVEWPHVALLAVAGALADIDFLLPLQHRGPTHGLGAAVLVFAAVLAMTSKARLALAVGAAYASHTLLDWLGADTAAPHGLMALWPVTHAYYVSGWDVFSAVDRRYWTDGFWLRNTMAVVREILILGPLTFIC